MDPRPRAAPKPRHIAIVMDGNGRWARARGSLRGDGHRAGVGPVRMVIEECVREQIGALTLFAFSSENWGRPRDEVMGLMSLFVESLEARSPSCIARGCACASSASAPSWMRGCAPPWRARSRPRPCNVRLALQVALSYGGRTDILGAVRRLALQVERHQLAARRSTSPPLQPRWRSAGCRIRICSSAPAASSASAISCCGTSRTPSCISPRRCGRTSMRRCVPGRTAALRGLDSDALV